MPVQLFGLAQDRRRYDDPRRGRADRRPEGTCRGAAHRRLFHRCYPSDPGILDLNTYCSQTALQQRKGIGCVLADTFRFLSLIPLQSRLPALPDRPVRLPLRLPLLLQRS